MNGLSNKAEYWISSVTKLRLPGQNEHGPEFFRPGRLSQGARWRRKTVVHWPDLWYNSYDNALQCPLQPGGID